MIRFKYSVFKIIFIGLILIPNFSYAIETLSNSGLVPSNAWYSKDPFYAGDKVRIYSVVFTGSTKDLRGRINFYDNNSLLCTSEFASLAGRMSEVWCDWTAVAGKHNISIKITNPRASAPGEPEQSVVLSNSELRLEERIVVNPPVSDTMKNEPVPETVKGENKINTGDGIVQKLAEVFSLGMDKIGGGLSGSVSSDKSSDDADLIAKSGELDKVTIPKIKSSVLAKDLTSFNKSIPSDENRVSQIETKSPLNYIAGIYPALVKMKDAFYSFTSMIADFVLPKLKSLSESDSTPIAYVMSFIYMVTKFILETPVVFATIILAGIWQLYEVIFKRGYDY